ncbi:YiiG family protein [Escherichia fergusonii]|uniref:YiiG family protein n=1 Tax=Escherichia fergusonii TaxID=564 RepID=UPI0015EE4578|nr:YiiG family protein [Escherichia fergusonii]MBA8277351.1 YiiG family protein [Escherichia fergusonii]QMH99234.1 YiiG family protein [Escherichia fergusonii]
MKRNLLSSAIVVAIMALGLSGCDDKKAETENPPPAKSQPAAPAPDAKSDAVPAVKVEAKVEMPAQPVVDVEAVYSEKMNVYIKCFNDLQIPVQRSLARYADWLKDFKQGPTGKESIVYGIYGIQELNIAGCEKGMKRVAALTPALEPIDGIATNYITAAVALGNTINEMDKYYTQENYKDDAFVKGKALHQTLLKNIETFQPVAEFYREAIEESNDRRQFAQLKNIEQREGKTFNYYSLAVMTSAKQINRTISQDKFDTDTVMKKVADLETLVSQAKEADKGGMEFSFINSAGEFQLAAKKYVRRVRDNVPYSDSDKDLLQDPASGWMVEDSYPAALNQYNELVSDYNNLR